MANRRPAKKKKMTSTQLRKKYKFVVKVPKSEARAYNPERAIGGLVTHQVQHLQFAMQALPNWHLAGAKATDVKTERGAAAFVAQATDALHQAGTPAKLKRPTRRSTAPARRKKAAAARGRKRGRRA
jgi:hypothetical protein